MKITVTSVMVDDQTRALDFYTRVLGFLPKRDLPAGAGRWLTVVSPEAPDGVELLLEPNAHPAAQAYQKALHADGIPLTSFAVDDLAKEHARVEAFGVVFTMKPTPMGPVTAAVLDDTCGNLIMLVEQRTKGQS
jgi:catechol 2,3-dioxygenase-like lactoylglutathione lyase family enzyme